MENHHPLIIIHYFIHFVRLTPEKPQKPFCCFEILMIGMIFVIKGFSTFTIDCLHSYINLHNTINICLFVMLEWDDAFSLKVGRKGTFCSFFISCR